MANEVRTTLDVDNVGTTLANSTTPTLLYSFTVPGGTLDIDNSLIMEAQGIIGFASGGSATLTLEAKYGGSTFAECSVTSGLTTAVSNKALFIDGRLSADDSVDSQNGILRSLLGVPALEDASVPLGFGSIGEGSNGDQDFEIWGTWSSASVNNTVTIQYTSLELLGFSENTTLPTLDEPSGYIFANSKLNNLRYGLRKKIYFYAPLEYELNFLGYGDVTFTRASTSTATWRDGGSHAVSVNFPRFEYNGETVLGMLITTASETLIFDSSNNLSDSNTLCWIENNVFKSTPTNTNIFAASGQLNGASGVHVRQIVKAKEVLTSAEINEIAYALSL